jgi:hypothetical protein
MKRLTSYFIKDFGHWEKVEFFKRALYIFLFFNTLSLLPIANDLFGYNGLVGSRGFSWIGTDAFLNLLSHPANNLRPWIFWIFISGQLLFLSLGFFRIKPVLSSVAIYFFTVNLFTKAGLYFTGGEVLVNIILFYLIFIQKNKHNSVLQNTINNTFYIILLIQICVLYFFSSFWKLYDENWTSGMALQYISKINYYSSNWMGNLFNNDLISKMATYGVLIYQATFPIFVWFKKVKIPFLILGVLIHLLISFGMGIFTFGIIMILTYILFLDVKHISKIKSIFNRDRTNG